ncbi:WGR domain-containing protein [Ochrobactrum soli]|nr:WGR domain-containing protein [[Ochrobactrum] soli]
MTQDSSEHAQFFHDLHRIDPERNMARFYHLRIERDLFGLWVLHRNWGRIGTFGQTKVQSFADRSDAEKHFDKMMRLKVRRGYLHMEEA